MKRYLCAAVAITLLGSALLGTTTSCSNDKEKEKTENINKRNQKEKRDTVGLPNYRYVDVDTLNFYYNLAKDFQESLLRMEENMQATEKQKTQAMQNFANQIQQKQQNNQYTQQTYEADMNKFQQMQANAEQELSKLQMNYINQQAQYQKILQDSVMNFIERYNKVHGYDAIFMKAATLYINPNMDITDEIIEGLNRSYNKK